MRRILYFMMVIIMVAIGSVWTFDYVSSDGDFIKWSHTTMGTEYYKDGRKFYLG